MDIGRRGAIKLIGGGLLTAGSGKAVYNVFLGYDVNLMNQDLQEVASRDLLPAVQSVGMEEGEVYAGESELSIRSLEGEYLGSVGFDDSGRRARENQERLGLEPALTQLHADVPDLREGDYEMRFMEFRDFFDYLEEVESREYTVGFLRDGYRGVDPGLVQEFAGVHPGDSRRLLEALVERFRERTSYDVPRYVAGSVTDNVLMRLVRLRPYFRHGVDYSALVSNGDTKLFCYEYVDRSVEALHSVPVWRQEPAVFGGSVLDRRHKHAYTAVGSVVRDSDDLVVPVTFVDYTRTTLYSDLGVAGLLGGGVNAYDSHHRASRIDW